MKQKGKKYILKESELKEIIQEMILMEIYEPDKYVANFEGGVPPGQSNLSSLFKNGFGDAVHNASQERNGGLGGWLDAVDRGVYDLENLNYAPIWLRNWFNSHRWRGGPGVGNGSNGDAQEMFFVPEAVAFLKRYAKPRYDPNTCGNCATKVREALNHGGLNAPWGMDASSAYQYIQVLPANGWYEIDESGAGQPGDVLVINRHAGHPDGHIAMCIGPDENGVTRWCADYIHSSGNKYGLANRPPANTIFFFRYANIAGENQGPPSILRGLWDSAGNLGNRIMDWLRNYSASGGRV